MLKFFFLRKGSEAFVSNKSFISTCSLGANFIIFFDQRTKRLCNYIVVFSNLVQRSSDKVYWHTSEIDLWNGENFVQVFGRDK